MKLRQKIALLGVLASAVASSASAQTTFDPNAQVSVITDFVSTSLTPLVTAIMTLAIGVFIVKLAMKFSRKSSS